MGEERGEGRGNRRGKEKGMRGVCPLEHHPSRGLSLRHSKRA